MSGWYILIIVSDLMSIIGSILKIEIQNKVPAESSSPRPAAAPSRDCVLLLLLGGHQLRHLQHLPGDGNHARVDRSHPLHGLLQEVQRRSRSMAASPHNVVVVVVVVFTHSASRLRPVSDPHPDTQGSVSKCDPVHLLCRDHLPWLLFLRLDRYRSVS